MTDVCTCYSHSFNSEGSFYLIRNDCPVHKGTLHPENERTVVEESGWPIYEFIDSDKKLTIGQMLDDREWPRDAKGELIFHKPAGNIPVGTLVIAKMNLREHIWDTAIVILDSSGLYLENGNIIAYPYLKNSKWVISDIVNKGSLLKMRMIKLIGYWQDRIDRLANINPKLIPYLNKELWQQQVEEEQYPWPGDLIDNNFWKAHDLGKVINYLKLGTPCNHYRGFSECRLCKKTLGTFERTDGVWCWPDRMEHYITEHSIILPIEFISDIETSKNVSDITPDTSIKVDESFWIEWSRDVRRV